MGKTDKTVKKEKTLDQPSEGRDQAASIRG